jgi:hypothetical protein
MVIDGTGIPRALSAVSKKNKKFEFCETNRFQIYIHRTSQQEDKSANNNPERNSRRIDGLGLDDS